MNIYDIYRYFGHKFRSRRMQAFVDMFHVNTETRILDVGGTPFNWSLVTVQPQITFLNIRPSSGRSISQLVANGCFLPFADNEFDIVYSNSVIEHLFSIENQRKFAVECSRVGQQLYIQTPNYNFWLEPHWLAPCFHWLPKSVQRRFARNFTGRGILARPSKEECDHLIDELRLLTEGELKALFSDSTIYYEHFLGSTKSLMIIQQTPTSS